MTVDSNPFEDRTLYTIVGADGERTTITIDKLTADVLQAVLPDVHAWVQSTFDRVATRRPHATRREQGNLVRALANAEAQRHPQFKAQIDGLL
jgi:hypothetical protein